MADEGSLQFTLGCTKAGMKDQRPFSFKFDVAGSRYHAGVQDIGTSWEAIAFPSDFGTPGVGFIANNDPTNYVEVGNLNGGSQVVLAKILPGETFPIRFGITKANIVLRANTAGVQVEVRIYEE